jgi:hypothetical protein
MLSMCQPILYTMFLYIASCGWLVQTLEVRAAMRRLDSEEAVQFVCS